MNDFEHSGDQSDDAVKQAYYLSVLFHGGMIFTLFIYLIVAESCAPLLGPVRSYCDNLTELRPALWLLAFLFLVSITLVRRIVLARRAPATRLPARTPLQQLTSLVITTAVLSHAIALSGVAIFLFRGARMDLYMLLALSLVVFSIHFPRLADWQQWVGEQSSAAVTG